MVEVPEGDFPMGDRIGLSDTDTLHLSRVFVRRFAIGRYPVTEFEYQAFVVEADYQAPYHWQDRDCPLGRANHPVVNVDWYDAMNYCAWLAEQTGLPYRPTYRSRVGESSAWHGRAGVAMGQQI
jgi:formylglycine-generating enzyme required for sulfatase activity